MSQQTKRSDYGALKVQGLSNSSQEQKRKWELKLYSFRWESVKIARGLQTLRIVWKSTDDDR